MADLIQRLDSLNKGREKINKGIEASERAEQKSDTSLATSSEAKQIAEEANSKSDHTQTQLDKVVGASTIDPAVEQMKVGSDGQTIYDSPDERVRTENRNITAQLAQTKRVTDFGYSVKGTRFIAHRGLSSVAPENTMPAFELAAKHGFFGIEFDIQITSDGHWVLFHDETLDNLTDGTGAVSNYTLSEIQGLTITGGSNIGLYPNLKIPTLEEALQYCSQLGLHLWIEVKSAFNSTDYPPLIDLIKKHNYEDKAIILCFDIYAIDAIRKLNAVIGTAYVSNSVTQAVKDQVVNQGKCIPTIYHLNTLQTDVDYFHQLGIPFGVFTVNRFNDIKRALKMGVDYITTDKIPNAKVV